MYFVIILCLFLSVVLIHYYQQSFMKKKYFQRIPGPQPLPIFGNALDFCTSSNKFLPKLVEYFNCHGDTIVLYARFFEVMLVTRDHKFTEYLLSSTKILQKAYLYSFLNNWLGTGLLTSTGVKWKKHRKMLTHSFHFSILTQFIKTFETVGDNFIKGLEREVGKDGVNIDSLVSRCTLDIICEATMGVSVNALDCENSEYVHNVKTMCTIIGDRIFSMIDRRLYFLTPNYFKEKKVLKVLHSYTEDVIEKRIQSKLNTKTTCSEDETQPTKKLAFLDLLLNCSVDGKLLSRDELREEVDTFMFGGHDTTSCALVFSMYSLATNPEIQQKAVEEQKRIFGSNHNAAVTVADLQEMRYLELVIKETLRLYPPVPLIGRQLPEDMEWEGSTLPKGLTVGVLLFALHRNPKYFPNPEKFIPERFENFEGNTPFSYIPFSGGPRNCIGQKFAMLEMKSILSKVIRNFELHPSVPAHVLELAPETILVSKNGVVINIKKRSWV